MGKKTEYCPIYDYSNLRGKIKAVLKTEYRFAEVLGRTQNFLTKVWNGISYFEQRDIDLGAKALGIEASEIGQYFFCLLSSQNEN